MNIRIKKAFCDIRNNMSRSLLVVFALVIGLWGAGSIIVTHTILNHDLRANYLRTDPAQIIYTAENFNRLDLKELKKLPEIESAEYRDISTLRIEAHPNVWIPMLTFGIEDFNRFQLARFFCQKGKAVPSPGTMLIERDGLRISDLDIGKAARVRSGKNNLNISVSGICYDPAQAPATQDHLIYAYVDKETFRDITGKDINQRLIIRVNHALSKQDVEKASDKILKYFGSTGISINSIEIPDFNVHPHQWQLNTLIFVIGSIGFLALLLSTVLVTQLMAAILAGQLRQIGILKAIGASKIKIFQIYLVMLLMFGIVSGIIAIPIAIFTGYAFSEFVSGILNFEILTKTLPVRIYVYLVSAGLLLPVILSFPTLLKGVNVSVADALSDYGIKQDTKGQSISRIPVPYTLVLAFRNTIRKTNRLAVTITAMALGVAIFSTGFNVRQSLIELLAGVQSAMGYDVKVALAEQLTREEAIAAFQTIPDIKHMGLWNRGRGILPLPLKAASSESLEIISLPYDTDLITPNVVSGRWIAPSEEIEIVMNQKAVEQFKNPAVGDLLDFLIAKQPVKARLVGIIEEFDLPRMYMDEKKYDAVCNPEHHVNTLLFVAEQNTYEQVIFLKKEIEKTITVSSLNVLYVISEAEWVKIIYDHLNIILSTVIFLASSVLLVSALGMASATGINIMERTREIGVMRAIGATPADIYHLFINEGMIISTISILMGMVFAWPLSIAASRFFGNLMLGDGAVLKYSFSSNGFWITLIVTFIFSLLATRIPAGSAIRVSTKDALAYE